VTDAPATHSRATSPRELDDMARELAGWGWIVRFELHSFAPGAPGGHLVLTRPFSSKAEYVVVRPRRHEIHVWIRTGEDTWPLGTVLDVEEAHQLLRREISAPGHAEESRSAAEKAFRQPVPCVPAVPAYLCDDLRLRSASAVAEPAPPPRLPPERHGHRPLRFPLRPTGL
jgi:hypothetical protein